MADETDELCALDPELGALVSAYETATARDAARVDAALARVTAKLGTAASTGGAASSTTAKLALVGAIFGVIAVAGLVALGPSTEPASTRTPARTDGRPPVVVDDAPRSVTVEPVAPQQRLDTPARPTIDTAAGPPTDAQRPSKARARPSKSLPPDAPDTLQAELELLRRARSALREGRALRALELVAEHRRGYPSSAVAEERDATEVSALCALGRRDEAEAKAKAAAMSGRSSRSTADLLGGCR